MSFFDLVRHLHKQGRLRVYAWFLLGRHRRVLAYLLIVIATAYAVYAVNQIGVKRAHDAEFVACQRVQILRDQTNGLALFAFDIYVNGEKRELALAKSDKTARSTHLKSAAGIRKIYQTLVVTGPTNCDQAVNNPRRYIAPTPHLIYRDGPIIKIVRQRSTGVIQSARNIG